MKNKQEISVPADGIVLKGLLRIPEGARGLVLFSHGSGSGRLSPRNNFVAEVLCEEKLAILLLDLLTPEEDEVYENRFNIELLTERLARAAKWIDSRSETRNLPLGIFGASTGAASALKLAARMGQKIYAVVSRGGRPDLAMDVLPKVLAPTLLIVGGEDDAVIELNRGAYGKIKVRKELVIIPGATHLFEEPGTLEEMARRAAKWFVENLPK